MKDEKSKHCEHCGAKMVMYWHCLNEGLVLALVNLYRNGKTRKAKDVCSHVQTCNFQKLKYWKLVVKQGNHLWTITEEGIRFVEGKTWQYSRVLTYRQIVQRYDGNPVYARDLLLFDYKQREEYAADAEPAGDISQGVLL